ncbi:MAG: hypothetical protein HRU15_03440 [Planctomycetes bacterium]|nr:hypothetical protein [Planctomycetota bacterium]
MAEITDGTIIFAVKSVIVIADKPPKARISMRKKVVDTEGTILGWTDAVTVKELGVGDILGAQDNKVTCKVNGKQVTVDFTSDWTVQWIGFDEKSILYYTIQAKVAGNGFATLGAKPYPYNNTSFAAAGLRANCKVVILKNSSGKKLVLPLFKIKKKRLKHPMFPNPQLCNLSIFNDINPELYVQPILNPEKPTQVPAQELKQYDNDAHTNTPFFTFADARFVYYDHLSKKLLSGPAE